MGRRGWRAARGGETRHAWPLLWSPGTFQRRSLVAGEQFATAKVPTTRAQQEAALPCFGDIFPPQFARSYVPGYACLESASRQHHTGKLRPALVHREGVTERRDPPGRV